MVKTAGSIVLVALLAGCAVDDRSKLESTPPSITTTESNCVLSRKGYSPRDYVMLRFSGEDAVRNFHIYAAAAILDDSETREEADSAVRTAADKVHMTLDQLDQQAESGRADAGQCFGVGDHGTASAEQYALTREALARLQREVSEETGRILAINKTLDEERESFTRWRAENRQLLVQDVGGMRLEIIRIAKRDVFGKPASAIQFMIEATNTTTSRILRPLNQKAFRVFGATLTDSFGNDYKLTSIAPRYFGNESAGIRPGQLVTFELRFGDVPLPNAESVQLVVEPAALGQQARAEFEIPSAAYYGAVTR